MGLRFFALVHKYSLVLDSIRIEKVIFFVFLGVAPLKYLVHIFNTLDFTEVTDGPTNQPAMITDDYFNPLYVSFVYIIILY